MGACCYWSSVAGALAGVFLISKLWNVLTRKKFQPQGKHVFITGGSTGLGLATAKKFASLGAKVTIVSRSKDNLAQAQREIERCLPASASPSSVVTIPCDVTDFDQMKRAVETACLSHKQRVDFLVCSAGLAVPGYFLEQDLSDFRKLMDLNYFGTLHAVKAVVPGMIEPTKEGGEVGGEVILVSSAAAFAGMIGYSQYCATKFAVRGLGDCLRNELLPYNIRVRVFYPSNIQSPGFEQEEKTKPKETRTIEGTATLSSPEAVADCLINGIISDRYAITNDIVVEVLRAACNGMAPRAHTMLELVFAPLLVFVQFAFVQYMDYVVRSSGKEKVKQGNVEKDVERSKKQR